MTSLSFNENQQEVDHLIDLLTPSYLEILSHLSAELRFSIQYVGSEIKDGIVRLRFKSSSHPVIFSLEYASRATRVPFQTTSVRFDEIKNQL